jgi:hypothetical protein
MHITKLSCGYRVNIHHLKAFFKFSSLQFRIIILRVLPTELAIIYSYLIFKIFRLKRNCKMSPRVRYKLTEYRYIIVVPLEINPEFFESLLKDRSLPFSVYSCDADFFGCLVRNEGHQIPIPW